jgi:hypothetical protein
MIAHRFCARRSFGFPIAVSSSRFPIPIQSLALLQHRSFTSSTYHHHVDHPLPTIPLPQSFTHDTLLTNKRILIANRGEIAIRISRAAKALGAQSLAVCAPEDVTSPHVLAADEFVVLEKGKSAIAPYLDIDGLTKVAMERGVDMVHPGE